MVAGVCGGLAYHLNVDVTVVRAAFIASLVFGGFGPAAYLGLWILLDSSHAPPSPGDQLSTGANSVAAGPTAPSGATVNPLRGGPAR